VSQQRSIPTPGSGRITLALLALVPAAMAYPWHSTRDYWLLGVAAAVVIVLFGWWNGLHFTTILRRRLAMLGRRGRPVPEPDCETKTTALLRIGPPTSDLNVLPLQLIARYLNCYGIRADAIRITSRDTDVRETWIGLTVSAVDNLKALQGRSSLIPLHETAQVTARRLADHLREIGWEAGTVGPDDAPRLLSSASGETWHGVRQGSHYLAAYRVGANDALPEALEAIRSHPALETWTALEIAGSGAQETVAVACAFLTDAQPTGAAPLAGLIRQGGNHIPALSAMDLLSTRRLDGHTDVPGDLLARLNWPTPEPGAHRAPQIVQ
jgi:type VII secretion protein EccE